MKKISIEYISISALSVHPSNPRKHSKSQIRQIAASIKTFGFNVPVLIDGNNRLICGHGRVEACRLLGIETIPAIRAADLDEAKIRAYMIADNRLTENSTWDEILLGENFQFLSDLELDFPLEITGFEYGDIEKLLIGCEDPAESGEAPLPDLSLIPAVAKAGDTWLLGKHRIVCGDSRTAAAYEELFLAGERAAIVFTDPPYNISAREIGQTCEAMHGDFAMGSGEMSPGEFTEFLATTFGHLKRYSEDGSIHYICMDWRHASEILTAGNQIYDEYKNLCVWAKSSAGMGTFYRSQHELVFVFKSGKGTHQNNFKLGQHDRYRSNVWRYPSVMHLEEKDGDKKGKEALQLHPTMKPVSLIEDALKDCSRRNEIVLDAFLGSGSTLIAAEKTNRVCYGIELSPRYVDVCINRWQEWTSEDAIHSATRLSYAQTKLN